MAFHHTVFYSNKQTPRSKIKNKQKRAIHFHITYANVMEAGQRISAEIGLKTAGAAQDTDSDTNWKKKGAGWRERKRIPDRRAEEAEERWLWWAGCHPAHKYPKERGEIQKKKSTPASPQDCSTSSIPPPKPSNTINRLLLRCSENQFFWRDEHKKKIPTGKEKSRLTSSVGQPKQILRRKSQRSPSMPPPTAKPHHTTSVCESWVVAYFHRISPPCSAGLMHGGIKSGGGTKTHFVVHRLGFFVHQLPF